MEQASTRRSSIGRGFLCQHRASAEDLAAYQDADQKDVYGQPERMGGLVRARNGWVVKHHNPGDDFRTIP